MKKNNFIGWNFKKEVGYFIGSIYFLMLLYDLLVEFMVLLLIWFESKRGWFIES